MGSLRNPLVPVGVVFILLGFGNWYTGYDKVVEHERLLAAGNLPARVEHFDEFSQLSGRTNASLLRPLQAGDDARSVLSDKLDFYRVMLAGGRMLVLLGLFTIAAGLIRFGYRRRMNGSDGNLPIAA